MVLQGDGPPSPSAEGLLRSQVDWPSPGSAAGCSSSRSRPWPWESFLAGLESLDSVDWLLACWAGLDGPDYGVGCDGDGSGGARVGIWTWRMSLSLAVIDRFQILTSVALQWQGACLAFAGAVAAAEASWRL